MMLVCLVLVCLNSILYITHKHPHIHINIYVSLYIDIYMSLQ